MISKIVAIGTIIVGWLAMTGFVVVYQYTLSLSLPRVFGSIGTFELPYYGVMSFKEASPVPALLIWLLAAAALRLVVDSTLAEPYKQYTYDSSSRMSEYASAFANLLSDLPEILRITLPIIQGFIIVIGYFFGVVAGSTFGYELSQKNLRGEATGLNVGNVTYNHVQVRLKTLAASSHDFRWYNTHKLLNDVWETDRTVYYAAPERGCHKKYRNNCNTEILFWTVEKSDISQTTRLRHIVSVSPMSSAKPNKVAMYFQATIMVAVVLAVVCLGVRRDVFISRLGPGQTLTVLTSHMPPELQIPAALSFRVINALARNTDVQLRLRTSTAEKIYWLKAGLLKNGATMSTRVDSTRLSFAGSLLSKMRRNGSRAAGDGKNN